MLPYHAPFVADDLGAPRKKPVQGEPKKKLAFPIVVNYKLRMQLRPDIRKTICIGRGEGKRKNTFTSRPPRLRIQR
jgi:hypothetical protein